MNLLTFEKILTEADTNLTNTATRASVTRMKIVKFNVEKEYGNGQDIRYAVVPDGHPEAPSNMDREEAIDFHQRLKADGYKIFTNGADARLVASGVTITSLIQDLISTLAAINDSNSTDDEKANRTTKATRRMERRFAAMR